MSLSRRFWNWLLNRRQVGPVLQPDALCCRCGAPAVEQWWPGVCALRGQVPLEWMSVCAECDVRLNEDYVHFLFGDKHNDLLAAYRRRALGEMREARGCST